MVELRQIDCGKTSVRPLCTLNTIQGDLYIAVIFNPFHLVAQTKDELLWSPKRLFFANMMKTIGVISCHTRWLLLC